MKRASLMCAVAVLMSGVAFAQQGQQQQPSPRGQAAQVDMNKVGPWTRKPKDERKTKQEIDTFLKEEDELMKSGDMQTMLSRVDFPVFLLTDDSKGTPMGEMYDRQKYTEMMQPFYQSMPKDMKVTHKHTVTVLSDSLASVTDDFTMTKGKQKYNGRSQSLLVKRDGQWKWKSVAEPGWGDMPQHAQGVGGAGTTTPNTGKKK